MLTLTPPAAMNERPFIASLLAREDE